MLHGHSLKSYHYKKKDMGYAKRNNIHAQESMMKKMEEEKNREKR
jgi:hypothetical protein